MKISNPIFAIGRLPLAISLCGLCALCGKKLLATEMLSGGRHPRTKDIFTAKVAKKSAKSQASLRPSPGSSNFIFPLCGK